MRPIPAFFGDEWDRFTTGITDLDPRSVGRRDIIAGRPGLHPGEASTITVPGWDSLIKHPTGPAPTGAQWREFHAARRDGRGADLPQDVINQANRLYQIREGIRTSNQPAWMRGIGSIMTAIDNVQDFASTLATVGRLALWAAPRIGARAVPIVGWIVLASDILNMMNLLGMVAVPAYALLCQGPRAAGAGAIPAIVLKNVLCREVWTNARLNPFSRQARAARRLRSMGRLPGISNMIEVAQVADSLFGWGLSLGAIYGMALETITALTGTGPTHNTRLNLTPAVRSLGMQYEGQIRAMTPAQRAVLSQAARVPVAAAILQSASDQLPEWIHFHTMTALLGAVSHLADFFGAAPHAELMADVAGQIWHPPDWTSDAVEGLMSDTPPTLRGQALWPVEGGEPFMSGEALTSHFGPAITRALTDFLKPRRNRPEMTYYGALVNQITDHLWVLFGEGTDPLTWQLTPDSVIMTAMAVDGLLIHPTAPEPAVWRFWTAARAAVAARGGRMLEKLPTLELAAQAGCPIVQLLNPGHPWPPEWAAWLATHEVHGHPPPA